jgi:hypothetical protein
MVSGFYAQPAGANANPPLQILSTHSGYLNDQKFYYVVGEVQNVGDTPLTDIYVNATFYNSIGDIIAEISQPTKLSALLPGRTSPFDITLFSTVVSQNVYNYTVRVVTFSSTQDRPLGLKILSNNSSLDQNGFHVVGMIKNVGPGNANAVRVIATFYNQSGHAVAAIGKYSDSSTLAANQTSSFEMVLNSSAASQVDHYALEAESFEYELIPELQPAISLLALMMSTLALAAIPKRNAKRTTPAR